MLWTIKIFMFLAWINLLEAKGNISGNLMMNKSSKIAARIIYNKLDHIYVTTECRYDRLNNRARDEGHLLGKYPYKSEKECEDICDSVSSCHSFSYATSFDLLNPNTCWLYDKVITICEPEIVWYDIYTVYKVCGEYFLNY